MSTFARAVSGGVCLLSLGFFLALASPASADITGTIYLDGTPSHPDVAVNTRRHAHCPDDLMTSHWQIGPRGELGEVLVWVEGAEVQNAPAQVVKEQCRFEPAILAVAPGTEVTFENRDPSLHNVRGIAHTHGRLGRNLFNLGLPRQGDRQAWTFDEAGFYRVECDVHRWMVCWIAVLESAAHAVTAADGTFRIEGDFPSGTHTLRAWHPQFPELLVAEVLVSGSEGRLELRFAAADASPAR